MSDYSSYNNRALEGCGLDDYSSYNNRALEGCGLDDYTSYNNRALEGCGYSSYNNRALEGGREEVFSERDRKAMIRLLGLANRKNPNYGDIPAFRKMRGVKKGMKNVTLPKKKRVALTPDEKKQLQQFKSYFPFTIETSIARHNKRGGKPRKRTNRKSIALLDYLQKLRSYRNDVLDGPPAVAAPRTSLSVAVPGPQEAPVARLAPPRPAPQKRRSATQAFLDEASKVYQRMK